MSPTTATLTVTNDVGRLPEVRELVRSAVERGGFPTRYLNRLQIAIDEAVTNIIEHGYAGLKPGEAAIALTISVDRDCFRIVIEDHGRAFDPQQLPEVDVGKHVAAGRAGGLGVFLMRRVMDEIQYHYESGKKNQLVLVKHRGAA